LKLALAEVRGVEGSETDTFVAINLRGSEIVSRDNKRHFVSVLFSYLELMEPAAEIKSRVHGSPAESVKSLLDFRDRVRFWHCVRIALH
jgi:hypothetical protein